MLVLNSFHSFCLGGTPTLCVYGRTLGGAPTFARGEKAESPFAESPCDDDDRKGDCKGENLESPCDDDRKCNRKGENPESPCDDKAHFWPPLACHPAVMMARFLAPSACDSF